MSDRNSYLIFAKLILLIHCFWILKLILLARHRHFVAFKDPFERVKLFILLETLIDLILQVQYELSILTILKIVFVVATYY